MDLALLMHVLVVNAGSSSMKLRLLDDQDGVLATENLPSIESSGAAQLASTIEAMTETAGVRVDAVGHRVVHGGTIFSGPVVVDDGVRAALDRLTDLAPLHQPKSLAALDAVTAVLPEVPAVACFDTAFHATIPPAASTYAVPREWRERYGVRRFGFHGLSHAYCARRSAELVGRPPEGLRIITCHLGAGASLTAVVDGRSVDTTMGFTPLDGLVMATRSGSVDPGLVLWLEEHEHLRPTDLATALEYRSGLLALAGTADMRVVEARAAQGDADAELALDVFIHRLVTSVGAMVAAAGGCDVLAFTGGVGERSPTVRARTVDRLAYLGARLDRAANAAADGDSDIGSASSMLRTLVVTAREDLQIAADTRRLLELVHPT